MCDQLRQLCQNIFFSLEKGNYTKFTYANQSTVREMRKIHSFNFSKIIYLHL